MRYSLIRPAIGIRLRNGTRTETNKLYEHWDWSSCHMDAKQYYYRRGPLSISLFGALTEVLRRQVKLHGRQGTEVSLSVFLPYIWEKIIITKNIQEKNKNI